MKNLVLILISLAALSACGSESPQKPAMAAKPKADISTNPDYQQGLDLISKSDCLTCHKIEEALIGPPYREVAKKYAGQADAVSMLAEKVMKGGTGVWGEVPMAAHPDMSKEDAEAMVKYILLLKP
ncbi:MAG: c-type cytochrome [Saprospiraceae bacterium]|nr:c-type cytochrome [Saprospiraceae bacterium]